MCLFTKQNKAKVAKEDIVCYKVVELNFNNIFMTPFRYTKLGTNLEGLSLKAEVHSMVVNKNGELIAKDIVVPNPYGTENIYEYVVEDGAVHSYKSIDGAKKLVNFFSQGGRNGKQVFYHIFECVIPSGSEYYVGNESMFGCGAACYASDEIKFIKEIQ